MATGLRATGLRRGLLEALLVLSALAAGYALWIVKDQSAAAPAGGCAETCAAHSTVRWTSMALAWRMS